MRLLSDGCCTLLWPATSWSLRGATCDRLPAAAGLRGFESVVSGGMHHSGAAGGNSFLVITKICFGGTVQLLASHCVMMRPPSNLSPSAAMTMSTTPNAISKHAASSDNLHTEAIRSSGSLCTAFIGLPELHTPRSRGIACALFFFEKMGPGSRSKTGPDFAASFWPRPSACGL